MRHVQDADAFKCLFQDSPLICAPWIRPGRRGSVDAGAHVDSVTACRTRHSSLWIRNADFDVRAVTCSSESNQRHKRERYTPYNLMASPKCPDDVLEGIF